MGLLAASFAIIASEKLAVGSVGRGSGSGSGRVALIN